MQRTILVHDYLVGKIDADTPGNSDVDSMSEFSFCIFGACAAKRGKLELSDRDRHAGSRRASHQDDQESYQASGDMGDRAKRRHKSTRVANNRGKMRRK